MRRREQSPTTSRSRDNRVAISKNAVNRMLQYKNGYSNQNIGNMNYWPRYAHTLASSWDGD